MTQNPLRVNDARIIEPGIKVARRERATLRRTRGGNAGLALAAARAATAMRTVRFLRDKA